MSMRHSFCILHSAFCIALATLCAASAGADPAASYFAVSGGTATINDFGDQFALVFSNEVSTTITLTALKGCTLVRTLVVGGGGAGGNTMGGGGGGGQVLSSSAVHAIAEDDVITLTVGAGGAVNGSNWIGAGSQGGTSSLTLPGGTTLLAYGGGGGGGYNEREPTDSTNGRIGSGGANGWGRNTPPTQGVHYNYGNPGGLNQGGGGGAGAAGENAGVHAESVLYGDETAYRTQAGYGGEGVTNDISGVAEVYGSGGGGGGGQDFWSQIHAPGGTHGGAGAVRTDKEGGGDGTRAALPADDGFGAGGGGGSFSQSGGGLASQPASRGGSGTVILRFSKADLSALVFSIDPIADQYYTGSAVTPAIVARHDADGTIVDSANYDVSFANNVGPGTAMVTATGKGAYAGITAEGSFTILNMMADEYVATDDLCMRRIIDGDRIVYVFTNTTDTVTVRALTNLTIVAALVVGGGGGGGQAVAGAGGGGAVVSADREHVVFEGGELTLSIGAGGLRATAASGYPSGNNGGTSTLTFPGGTSLVAYGGGGGGGYQKQPGTALNGEIASGGGAGGGGNTSAGTDGVNYSSLYGNSGGSAVYDYAGGGGGAGAAGSAGTASGGGDGGEGVANSITGIAEVYGSGGGGGARNNGVPGAGGTNAGSGTNGTATVHAPSGRDGFGGGGGGGGYAIGTGLNYQGGDGGCGTVILAFVLGGSVGQPTIGQSAITFPDGITQPKVSVMLGNSIPNSDFSASVTITLRDGNGNELAARTFNGIAQGAPIEWLAPLCVEPGATVVAHIGVTCEGANPVSGTTSAVAAGVVSPYYGRGGGAGVIHVRPGATGSGDGSDWFNAYPDFRAAIGLIDSTRTEVWFAGDEVAATVKLTIMPEVPVTIRGGFNGTENSPAERARGALSLCDAANVGYCFDFASDYAVTLDGFWLKNGKDHNLNKSGVGDITVTNCVISDASGVGVASGSRQGSGHGGYLTGGATAVARLSDVRFANLFGGSTVGKNIGTALYLQTFSRVFIDGCTFTSNGCPFSTGVGNSMYDMDGAAIYAKNAPMTVRGTRFLANRSQALTAGGNGGGVVRIDGACGATAFTNCLFAGNEVVHAFGDKTTYKSPDAGMLVAKPSSGTIDIVNCTFAMGLASVTCGSAAVTARGGTVNVLNSIFYGNTNCAWNTAGSDIYVAKGATANVSYCLFEDASEGRIVCAAGGTTNLATSTFTYGNPLFMTADDPSGFVEDCGILIRLKASRQGELAAFNAHLRCRAGYTDETTGGLVKPSGPAISPAIDAGDPASDYGLEPDGLTGRRINLGFYGNTPWATMSVKTGFFLILQ